MTDEVVFALTGEVARNSRALKQLKLFAGMGARVRVFDLAEPASSAGEVSGAQVVSLGRPPGSGPRFFWENHRRLKRALEGVEAAVYHASDLYVLPALARAARRTGGRLVYDARELYPFVASTAGRPWATLFWHALEGRFIRPADAVFTVSPSIAERLATMYGIPSPAVLYNVPEWQDVARSDRLREVIGVPTDQAIVLHQGNVQHGRGAETLVEAMRQVRGAALVFLGGGAGRSALEVRVRENGIRHVHFLDAVPPADLLPITASADIGVTLLEDNCLNHHFALPNKLFEYLMAGLPVVGSDLPEIRRVVAGFDVGTLVDAGDPAAVAGGIQALLDDPERRAACAARARPACETFRWERASEPFVRTYRRLLEARPK